MIVCGCKAVSEKHIQAAVENGAVSFSQIVRELGLGTCCGTCVSYAKEATTSRVRPASWERAARAEQIAA